MYKKIIVLTTVVVVKFFFFLPPTSAQSTLQWCVETLAIVVCSKLHNNRLKNNQLIIENIC